MENDIQLYTLSLRVVKKNHIQNVCLCSDIDTFVITDWKACSATPALFRFLSCRFSSAQFLISILIREWDTWHISHVQRGYKSHIWEFMTSLISFCPFSLHFLIITPIFSPVSASLVTLFPQGETLARPGTFGVGCPILNCHSPKFSQPSSHCNL